MTTQFVTIIYYLVCVKLETRSRDVHRVWFSLGPKWRKRAFVIAGLAKQAADSTGKRRFIPVPRAAQGGWNTSVHEGMEAAYILQVRTATKPQRPQNARGPGGTAFQSYFASRGESSGLGIECGSMV